MRRRFGTLRAKIRCTVLALFASLCAQAQVEAQHERVMGAATEGSQHRIRYLEELERKSAERIRCRALVDTVIQPQLARYEELGVSRTHGPYRAQFEDASLEQVQATVHALRVRLLTLAKALRDSRSHSSAARKQLDLQFAASFRSYTLNAKKLSQSAQESVRKRVAAAQKFKLFAQAILTLRDSSECAFLWSRVKVKLPQRLGQRLHWERRRAVARARSTEKQNQQFVSLISGLKDPPQAGRTVADSPTNADN